MPELPDVEYFRQYFSRYARGLRVRKVLVLDHSLVRNTTARSFERQLTGRRFKAPYCHGKWLLVPVDSMTLFIHFGMTGLLKWTEQSHWSPHPHDRVLFLFSTGVLRYRNQRKLGGLWLARSKAETARRLKDLGPDALAIRREEFQKRLALSRARLKPAFMNQRLISGLGNLLVDEILWQASLNPLRAAATLTTGKRGHLYTTMRNVLKKSVPTGRVPGYRPWLTGARRLGGTCPRCRRPLRRAKLATRTSYWCPRCPLP